MVAFDGPPLTGVLLDVGGTLWSERWTPDPPLMAERMRSALPNASSTELDMLREEFTRLAASIDWSVEQDVHQLITSAASLAGPPSAARRCVCCRPSDVSASRWVSTRSASSRPTVWPESLMPAASPERRTRVKRRHPTHLVCKLHLHGVRATTGPSREGSLAMRALQGARTPKDQLTLPRRPDWLRADEVNDVGPWP